MVAQKAATIGILSDGRFRRRTARPAIMDRDDEPRGDEGWEGVDVRIGNVEIRPLGGGLGCLLMILFSVLASVVLTIGLNLLIR